MLLVPIAFIGFGHTSVSECFNRIDEDEVSVKGADGLIKLDKLCKSRHRY